MQVEFYIYKKEWTKEKTEEIFNFLHERKEKIEKNFEEEEKLEWDKAEGKKHCRIYITRPVKNYENEKEEQEIIKWLCDRTRKFEEAFDPHMKRFKAGNKRRVNF